MPSCVRPAPYCTSVANNRVFLSWSGSRAKEIAQIWKALIEESFDSVDAFVPSRDIDPGERGLSAIKEQLDGTSVGIPIITRDNVNPPWINFESGALSKQVPNAPVMVMPCLVDYKDPSELIGPLLQFQSKLLDKDGVAAILETIAKANSIDWQRKKPAFEARWGEFEAQFDMLRDESPVGDSETRRSEPDMLAEIVNNTREIRKMFVVNPIPTQVGDTWAIRLHDQGKLEQQRRHLQVGLFAGH
ncbi:Uncharacterised protein [Mycobacteroides abscessus subsp. bolletii]|nr:TIR domain-containing protein [Mycobacteroides abscessus]SHX99282.1 Uncharacterised protein [Mycobacteroides abscessus subsp. bolletii]SIN25810.1 Uncharacterised protein [Mycobacteroides abscessus subsp. abscessus]RIQ98194.1 TIR domain-containing protein [Mycobacteroides abscessus]RIR29226.1 TIR domain-containing protein [Mycobacteroides abscessus]